MVKDDLLVIETHDSKTRGRKTSQEVHKKLSDMLKNCEADKDYACKPAPHLDAVDEKTTEEYQSREYRWIETFDLPEATSSAGPGASGIKQF